MKRLITSCLWSMVFITLGFAQTQEGRGTWYETESMGLSASHANIPFGSRVRVTNLQNNRQVIVTIDNRIADTPNRIIDISKAASTNLEMNPRGTTPVRIEVLARRQAATTEPPPETIAAVPPPEEPPPDVPVTPPPETPPEPSGGPPPEEPAVPAKDEPKPESQVLPSQGGPGMVNQTIITFNGMPGYVQNPGAYSQVLGTPSPTITASGGRQVTMGAEPALTAQEVPVPAPAPMVMEPVLRSPEPVIRSPEPIVRAPEPVIVAPQPMVMQPTIVSPVIVPPVVVPPVLAEPILAPPVLAEPILAPPVLAEPVLAPPVLTPPVLTEPIVTSPVLSEPLVTAPITTEPILTAPVTTEPVMSLPIPTVPIITPPVSSPAVAVESAKPSPIYSMPPYTDTVPIVPAVPDVSRIPPVRHAERPVISIQVIPRLPDPRSGRLYRLQVGAFSNELYARDAIFRLREAGLEPAYELYGGYCRVVLAKIRAVDVEGIVRRAGGAGFSQIFIREE